MVAKLKHQCYTWFNNQKKGENMKESKKRLVRDVASKINKLPEDDQQYILGIMDGIMLSSGNARREEKQREEVSN